MSLFLLRLSAGLIAVLLLGAGAGTAPARADVFRAAQYSLSEDDEETNHFLFTAQIPAEAVTAATPVWPTGCESLSKDRQVLGKRLQYSFVFACANGLQPGASIKAPWSIDGATFFTNLSGDLRQDILPGSLTGVTLTVFDADTLDRSFGQAASYYTWQGMVHIWMGWDHLAFVLCLCLVSAGRQLLVLVTAFTLGHSISLGLAFFDVVRIPIPPVEAIIAFSIALMAREAIFYAQRSALTQPSVGRYGLIVSLFGLLHGLGFASALGGLGVGQNERVSGLIFFNIGVEIGQLVFVAVVTALLLGIRRGSGQLNSLEKRARIAAAVGAGILGCFWTIERVAGFPWA